MSEFENEKVRGLPGPLPNGERIIWRGSPEWRGLAWRAFHVREALAWFALIGVARIASSCAGGSRLIDALAAQMMLVPIGILAVALLCGLAWCSARTTIYTLTNKRIVMRIGIALPLTINLPYSKIGDAFLRADADGTGDIGVVFHDRTRLAWLVLWPHCRPWRVRHPEPMLRAIPDVARVADLLSAGLAATTESGAFVRTGAGPSVATVKPVTDALPVSSVGATT